jgi:hypothetical protein
MIMSFRKNDRPAILIGCTGPRKSIGAGRAGFAHTFGEFSPNGRFGVWWLFPPMVVELVVEPVETLSRHPALAGNACRWALAQISQSYKKGVHVMATTCPNCNTTDFSSEKYYLNVQTGDKTILASGKKDSSIIAIFVLLFGLGLLFGGIYTLPLLFSNGSSYLGTILLALAGGAALTWNSIGTLRKNILLSKLTLITEYTCKSCNHVWQVQHPTTKKPVYLTLLPIGAGFFSCIFTAILALRFDPSQLMIMLLIGIVVSSVVFYVTKQWIEKNFK